MQPETTTFNSSRQMLIILLTFILFPGTAMCALPWTQSNWALTQVFVYHAAEFDRDRISIKPSCFGTLLTVEHILARGSCVINQERLWVGKVNTKLIKPYK